MLTDPPVSFELSDFPPLANQQALALLETSTDGVFVVDADWRFVYLSPNSEVSFRKTRAELIGKSLWEEYPATLNTRFFTEYHRAMKERISVSTEDYDPSEKQWYEGHASPFQSGLLIYFRNITARKRAEAALRESEERYRDLVENSGLFVGTHDVAGKILSANQSVLQFKYWKQEVQVVGKNVQDVLAPEVQHLFPLYLEQLLTHGHAQGRMKIRMPHGEVRWLEYDNSLRRDGPEPVVRCIGRDVTERVCAEAALARSETRFRSLSSFAPIGIFQTDIAGQCLYANERWKEIFGVSPEDTYGTDDDAWSQRLHPEDRARVLAVWRAATGQKREYEDEFRVLTNEGTVRWVRGRAQPMHDESGHLLGYVGTDEDITERKHAEHALYESETRFRSLSASAPLGIFHTDATGQCLYTNTRCQEIFGLSFIECLGNGWSRAVHPDDREQVLNNWLAAAKLGRECDIQFRVLKPDGKIRFVRARKKAMYSETGQLIGYVGTEEDITERIRAEEQLREQAALLQHMQEAIIVCNAAGEVLFWNPSAERIYGWHADEVVGREMCAEICASHEELAAIFAQNEGIGEMRHRTKTGREIIVESHWTRVQDEHGNHKSTLFINTDITEKKRLEAQSLRAQRLESIGALASGIAHDLNNLLSPMIMVEHILNLRLADPHSQSLLETLRSSIQRASGLVKQVVSFARGSEGQSTTICPKHLLRDVVRLLGETFPRPITIHTEEPTGLSAVEGDATQLFQVLMNLCVNARDAMPHGGTLTLTAANVEITSDDLAAQPQAQPGRYVCLTVADTGEGIPVHIREQIFDPFFTTKEPGRGTGLGLATAHRIVTRHSGFIAVNSEVGQGSQFHVYLPAATSTDPAPPESEAQVLPVGHGELILVVEDEAAIREVTRETLETYGYQVITASEGTGAVALYAQHLAEVKAVVLDLVVPAMDGRALIRALRKLNPHCIIIGTSGLLLHEQLSDPAWEGITQFLSKPFTAEKLLKTLAAVLLPTPSQP